MINSHEDSFYGQPLNTQSYEQRIKTLTVVIEDLGFKNAELTQQIAHWKGNVKDMADRNAFLRERPDLPVDRLLAMRRMEKLQKELVDQKEMFDACYKDREYYREMVSKYEAQIAVMQQVVEVNQRTAERYIRLFKAKFSVKDILQLEADSGRYKHLISNKRGYRIQLPYVGLQTKADYDEAIDREIALDKAYNPADTGTLQH